MDDIYRIKATYGQDTFEAEGPTETVRADFLAWRDMVSTAPPQPRPQPQSEPTKTGFQQPPPPPKTETPSIDTALPKIMKVEDRVISLTARPGTAAEAVLLVLYGQKILRENDAVTGAEVMDGITATGGFSILRVDRLLENMGRNGDVIVIGEHRAKRYRLTNTGIARARQIAVEMIALVA
jgi:hypothetical protein